MKESFNLRDPYAVATLRGGVVVGHVPRIVLAVCSAFIRGGGASCEVTGARQYSADLSQGGMEVPCKLTFTAPSKEIDKLHNYYHVPISRRQVSSLITSASPILLLSQL